MSQSTNKRTLLKWRLPEQAVLCEERLVLSALPIADVFLQAALDAIESSDNGLEPAAPLDALESVADADSEEAWLNTAGVFGDYGDVGNATTPFGPNLPPGWQTPNLQPFLADAHEQTGYNDARESFGLQGSGQTVAVIDSGIAWDHTALGQGFGAGYRVVGGWDFAENDAVPYDDAPAGFHGTHVAGIIGSDDPVNSGVAPEVDLVALRVFDDNGFGEIGWVEDSLQWVLENHDAFENPITTVNLSLGTNFNGDSPPAFAQLEDEFRQLHDAGIVVVASAGNSFQEFNATGVSYPAASPYVLPVASLDDNGQISDFSQRNSNVLAAPGRSILSTVPDHVFGSDGVVNDFASASGTSMAAPYVSGAAVLVREAFELAGFEDITVGQIVETLQSTAGSVFDNVTGMSFDTLDINAAIESIIPADSTGDSVAESTLIADLQSSTSIENWINTTSDRDVYHFVADTSGTLTLNAEFNGHSELQWSISDGSGTLGSSGLADSVAAGSQVIEVIAGQQYSIELSSDGSIGRYEIDLSFEAHVNDGEGGGTESSNGGSTQSGGWHEPDFNLGDIGFQQLDVTGGETIQFVATNSGPAVIQFDASDSADHGIELLNQIGLVGSDFSAESGTLTIAVELVEGQEYQLQLSDAVGNNIDGNSINGSVTIVNTISVDGQLANISGTSDPDQIRIHVAEVTTIDFNGTSIELDPNIASIELDGGINNDSLDILGDDGSSAFRFAPQLANYASDRVEVTAIGFENVSFDGGGGSDRAFLSGSSGDDTLFADPSSARFSGPGFSANLNDVDRIFVDGSDGGQDQAFINDSAGDDVLSIRPQFSSIRSDAYFNYFAGFERVFVYATEGGEDIARLYDSAGDDTFNSSGAVASIVRSGLFSFTRGFETVEAYSTAGGNDIANLFASDSSEIATGLGFVELERDGFERVARGFGQASTFVEGASTDQLTAATLNEELGTDAAANQIEPSNSDWTTVNAFDRATESLSDMINIASEQSSWQSARQEELLASLLWLERAEEESEIAARLFARFE